MLSGEAGIGKTTTLSWLAGTAAGAGMAVLAGRAVADEGAPAFWPWLRAFAAGRDLGLSPDLLDLDAGPPAQARIVAIERQPARCWPPCRPSGCSSPLDDLQWADDATVQLLRHIDAALEVAGEAVMSTKLLPGEDPALLPGPDRVTLLRVAAYRAVAVQSAR